LVALLVWSSAVFACADTVLLSANFEGKPVDQPIGTGGPTVGEPVYVGSQIVATIRSAPLPTSCLEISDNDDSAAGYVGFEFLDTGEAAFATVIIMATLWFTEEGMGDYYTFGVVGENGLVPRPHVSLLFVNGSRIHVADTTGYETDVGSFTIGRPVALLMVLDLVSGTYDLWVDDVLLLDKRPHAFSEQGIDLLTVGCGHDPDLSGGVYVDDVTVVATLPPVVAESTVWGAVKALYR
jgi:hypothetical protein